MIIIPEEQGCKNPLNYYYAIIEPLMFIRQLGPSSLNKYDFQRCLCARMTYNLCYRRIYASFCAVNESKSVGTLCTVSYFRSGLESKMFLSQTSLERKPKCGAALCLYLQHNMWLGYAADSCRTTFALCPEIAKRSVVSSAEMESDGEFAPVMTQYFCV